MSTDQLTPCAPCGTMDAAGLERTRFFVRQLVTPDDLTQDQVYFREKLRRHNRLLHGWGVVCGACVRAGPQPCQVVIQAGYILGPCGDEIVIGSDTTVDICALGAGEQIGCCGDPADPWCADVRAQCVDGGTLYLAVRYAECNTRPVPAGGDCGCGCSDASCDFSRVRDGYAIKLLRTLPASYSGGYYYGSAGGLAGSAGVGIVGGPRAYARPCPPCPTDPWVIVATITVAADCSVRAIDCFKYRRQVVSLAGLVITGSDMPWPWTTVPGAAGVTPDLVPPPPAPTAPAGSGWAGLVTDLTVGEIAQMTRDAFVARATAGVPKAAQKTATTKARAMWNAASQAAKATDASGTPP